MPRQPNTNERGGPFDEATIEKVWAKGAYVSATQRKDMCGTLMTRSDHGKSTTYGWEMDHKKPMAKGGTDDLDNLQPLQWENNRHKGDDYPNWSCKVRG